MPSALELGTSFKDSWLDAVWYAQYTVKHRCLTLPTNHKVHQMVCSPHILRLPLFLILYEKRGFYWIAKREKRNPRATTKKAKIEANITVLPCNTHSVPFLPVCLHRNGDRKWTSVNFKGCHVNRIHIKLAK